MVWLIIRKFNFRKPEYKIRMGGQLINTVSLLSSDRHFIIYTFKHKFFLLFWIVSDG